MVDDRDDDDDGDDDDEDDCHDGDDSVMMDGWMNGWMDGWREGWMDSYDGDDEDGDDGYAAEYTERNVAVCVEQTFRTNMNRFAKVDCGGLTAQDMRPRERFGVGT